MDMAPYGQGMNGAFANPRAWTVADLMAAFRMGTNGKLGFRLFLGNGGASNQADTAAGASGDGQFVLGVSGGYSLSGERLKLDLALQFVFHSLGDITNGTDNQQGSNIFLSVGSRAFLKIDQELSIGILGDVRINSHGLTTYAGATQKEASEMNWHVRLGAGPVYHIKDKATIAGYVTLEFGGLSDDPDNRALEDETSTTELILPGVLLAAEIQVFKWFYTRFGVGYKYRIALKRTEKIKTDDTTYGGEFNWTAGVGFRVGDFNFDGSLQQKWLTEGPAMLGQGGTLFGMVAARYRF